MSHRYTLLTIVGWYLFGLIQWVRHTVPDFIVRPERVSRYPPGWWTHYASWGAWFYCVGDDLYPRDCWFDAYFQAVWLALGHWVEEVGQWALGQARDFTRGITGWVQWGYSTFEHWLNAMRLRLGTYVPHFGADLADAANWLYLRLPSSIRHGLRSWADIWQSIRDDVIEWVQTAYGNAAGLALAAWTWVTETGQTLKAWWDNAHDWLDDFRQHTRERITSILGDAWGWLVSFHENPYHRITSILGPTWQRLASFGQEAVTFYFNLWGSHWREIGAFWADPLGWLYDRAEAFLLDKW